MIVGGCDVLACTTGLRRSTHRSPTWRRQRRRSTLTLGANNKVTLPANDNDAYSLFLTFTANRAHLTGETCTVAADCQNGTTCVSGTCQ